MIQLPRVLAAAGELQDFCQCRRWLFCLIGGIAVQRWGEPRLTQDVDITLHTGFGNEEQFVDPLLVAFAGRRPDAREFALTRRVQDSHPVRIDFRGVPTYQTRPCLIFMALSAISS